MKKAARIALMLAMATGFTFQAGMASAANLDNLKINIDGVFSYYSDPDFLNKYDPWDNNGDKATHYFNSYTRVRFNYKVDNNISFTARLHSGYTNSWYGVTDPNSNGDTSKGTYFDQAYLQYGVPQSKISFKLGKAGGYLGEGMVYNSSGNLTGAIASYGNWGDPTQVQLYFGNKDGGQNFRAINLQQKIAPNVEMTGTYISYRGQSMGTYQPLKTWQTKPVNVGSRAQAAPFQRPVYINGKPYISYGKPVGLANNNYKNNIYSIGAKAKLKGVTLVSEMSRNTHTYGNGNDDARRGYYVELYTGPTNDFTGGLPKQKVGTGVLSVRYQDIGNNSVISPTNGFYPDYKGWRVDYGKTIAKGVSADIAFSSMKQKSNPNGKTKNMVVAQVAYKF